MKVYTRGGDRGKTGVWGGGRVEKDSARIECVGTIDEINATIGLLRAKIAPGHNWQEGLHRIQKDIMNMMSHLSRPSSCEKQNVNEKPVDGAAFCESWIDDIHSRLKTESDYFLLPGGNEVSALCHVVRTQLRRAERRLVSLSREDEACVEDYILKYFNRLSDLFFVLAREEMEVSEIIEERWKQFRYKKKQNSSQKN